MNNKETMEKVLDAVIKDGARLAGEDLANSDQEPMDVEFSKEHEAKMQELFDRERNKIKQQNSKKNRKRMALIFLAAIIAIGTTIFSVGALRIRVLNFFIDMQQTHTNIKFDDTTDSDSFHSDEISLDYIPEGFDLTESTSDELKVFLTFTKDEQYFQILITSVDVKMAVDTENADISKISINGQNALFSSNHNVNILVWHDDMFSYRLSGNIEKGDIIKIAEMMKYKMS